jgi:beta-glucanase (GH16 family)
MRAGAAMMAAILLSSALLCGCGGGAGATAPATPAVQTAAPGIVSFNNSALQNGAAMVVLGFTGAGSPAAGSVIYYTVDGATPTTNSTRYVTTFLVATNLTVKAIAQAPGETVSSVASQSFTPNIASGTLVWSDEFNNSTGVSAQPSSMLWTYDTGNSGFGNSELENYCAWGSSASPCSAASPNAYVGADGSLHIVAQQPSAGVYTSARLKSQGLFSFQYGRIEARMKLPEGQGMWPAFWLLGNNITTVDWPACGELDVMEHIDGSNPKNEGFDWVQGSIHGTGINGGIQYHPAGFSAAAWHTYGMIWSKGQIQYYVDDPANVYATFNSTTQVGTWPFDAGPQFVILNLAVGGSWPGSPDSSTVFPSEMLVDYVRVYTN